MVDERGDIYLDNHATTRIDPRVLEAMLPWLTDRYGNAGSVTHARGLEAREAVERARGQIAAAIGATPEEVVFTSGATEAINIALVGAVRRSERNAASGTDGPKSPGGIHVVSLETEHRAALDPLAHLAAGGCEVTLLPVDGEGFVTARAVAAAVRRETRLVSILLANNEIGTIQPVAAIAAAIREPSRSLHVDASQALGRIPVDVDALDCDLASFSSHKLHGPKGCGCLFVRRRGRPCRIDPVLHGGGQERGLRPGTLDVPAIVGFGTAATLAVESLAEEPERLAGLRDRLWGALAAGIAGIRLNGPALERRAERLPNNLNVRIPGVDGQTVLAAVAARGLAISAASACASAEPAISHVLRGIGLDDDSARCSLRFGLSRFTTPREVDSAAAIVSAAVAELRPH